MRVFFALRASGERRLLISTHYDFDGIFLYVSSRDLY